MNAIQTPGECINELIRVTAESEAAFHAAVAAVRGDEARALLLDRAYRFARAAAALRAIGRDQAIEPPSLGHVSAPSGDDDASILSDCERREDRAIVAFRDALEAALPSNVRRTVEREFDSLLARLGSLRALRDRLARRVPREQVPQ